MRRVVEDEFNDDDATTPRAYPLARARTDAPPLDPSSIIFLSLVFHKFHKFHPWMDRRDTR